MECPAIGRHGCRQKQKYKQYAGYLLHHFPFSWFQVITFPLISFIVSFILFSSSKLATLPPIGECRSSLFRRNAFSAGIKLCGSVKLTNQVSFISLLLTVFDFINPSRQCVSSNLYIFPF